MIKKITTLLSTAVLSVAYGTANAATLTATAGIVEVSSGIIDSLAPVGSLVSATAFIAPSIIIDEQVDEADVFSIRVEVGAVCIASADEVVNCAPGLQPIVAEPNPNFPDSVAQPGSFVDLTSGGSVSLLGNLDLGIPGSPPVPVPLILDFAVPSTDDIINGERIITGTLDFRTESGSALVGDASGVVSYSLVQAVPVPASVWLMGSALLGMVAVRRRKILN